MAFKLNSDEVFFTLISDAGGNISTQILMCENDSKFLMMAVNLILKKGGHIQPPPPFRTKVISLSITINYVGEDGLPEVRQDGRRPTRLQVQIV